MNKKTAKISDLVPDDRNANKHSEYGMQRLEKGLRQNGLGRSILISSDNKIIAGNGVTETAGAIGIENVKIIETDGKEIIAVKRTDIKSGTKEFYEMALSDNIIAKENIVMDAEVVDAICDEYEIDEWKESTLPEMEFDNEMPSVIKNIDEIKKIREQREKGNQSVIEKTDTEKYLVIVFNTRDEKENLLKRLELPSDERYIPSNGIQIIRTARWKNKFSSSSQKKSGATG